MDRISIRSERGADGRFQHPAEHFPDWIDHGFSGFRKWQRAVEKTPLLSKAELEASLPVQKPSAAVLTSPPQGEIQVTWLGHASVLTQFDGWNILADPIFSARCSPVQWAGPERVRPPPLCAEELPRIDAVVISHSHYDHLDLETVLALASRPQGGEPPVWFVPLGMQAWFVAAGVSNVVEMDWAQQATLSCTRRETESNPYEAVRPDLIVTCLPCQHWCARTPFDRNRVLWASWHVATNVDAAANLSSANLSSASATSSASESASFYFGGDTGYCGHAFRHLGEAFGSIDLAAIPIGAYGGPTETWFHKPSHMNPEEAVRCRGDLRAKHAVAVHWGTFQLTAEPLLEPPQRLRAAAKLAGLTEDQFAVLAHGETRCFPCADTKERDTRAGGVDHPRL